MKIVFISQPMNGKIGKDILAERDIAMERARELMGNDVKFIDSFYENQTPGNSLSCLGSAIELMGCADAVFFAKGWQKARGCRIEEACARAYGKEIVYFSDEV